MNGPQDRDGWLARLHRWRSRNAWGVQLAILSLCGLALALSLFWRD